MDPDRRLSTHARSAAPNQYKSPGVRKATGLRKLTPAMLDTILAADAYGISTPILPGQALSAFKAAAPFLGLRPNVVHAVDWLFRFTNPIDWQPASRPIVWPSAAMQQHDLGLGVSQVKSLNRHLVELGLVVMRDSPNGKRYGRRGPHGRIIEAYGFDLSPLASRIAEFQAIVQAGREERARMAALRRRATMARNRIRQLSVTADEQAISGDEWESCRHAGTTASRGLTAQRNADDLEISVATLERVQCAMHRYLEIAFTQPDAAPPTSGPSVNTDPDGPENRPHITTTNQLSDLKDTVVASGPGTFAPTPQAAGAGAVEASARQPHPPQPVPTAKPPRERSDHDEILKLNPTELTRLAPRLTPYLRNTAPKWSEIVEAADWLRNEMAIPQFIWGEACLTLGREQAAIAIAIISAKPPTHFNSSAGAYFHGMITRAKAGELHLNRTIWAMRH